MVIVSMMITMMDVTVLIIVLIGIRLTRIIISFPKKMVMISLNNNNDYNKSVYINSFIINNVI